MVNISFVVSLHLHTVIKHSCISLHFSSRFGVSGHRIRTSIKSRKFTRMEALIFLSSFLWSYSRGYSRRRPCDSSDRIMVSSIAIVWPNMRKLPLLGNGFGGGGVHLFFKFWSVYSLMYRIGGSGKIDDSSLLALFASVDGFESWSSWDIIAVSRSFDGQNEDCLEINSNLSCRWKTRDFVLSIFLAVAQSTIDQNNSSVAQLKKSRSSLIFSKLGNSKLENFIWSIFIKSTEEQWLQRARRRLFWRSIVCQVMILQ